MKISSAVTSKYLDAEWSKVSEPRKIGRKGGITDTQSKYNRGLLELTTPSKAKGPIIATGADHFVQLGRPDLVAQEVFEMLGKIQDRS